MPPTPFRLPDGWTARTLTALRRKLLDWFDAHHRKLPWREPPVAHAPGSPSAAPNAVRDPYPIWVSEVMLQQTTVAAVVPYFERFLAAFPTVQALAAADEQDVLRLWEGLGYYRRARHLHAAAKKLVADHGGTLPDDPDVWADLPGVGRYILGAVLSQAFDRRLPIVEANSLRVLSRLLGFRGDPREGDGKAWVWAAAEAVLPARRAGDFNQAVMELGALVCTPAAPACDRCPFAGVCVANRDGLQADIPPKKVHRAVTAVEEVAAVVRDGAKVLLCRRPEGAGRWAGLWEVPHAGRSAGESAAVAAVRVAKELTGLDVTPGEEILTVRHGITRYAVTMACVEAAVRGGAFASAFYAEGRWVDPAELGTFPVSSPQRVLLRELAKPSRQPRLF